MLNGLRETQTVSLTFGLDEGARIALGLALADVMEANGHQRLILLSLYHGLGEKSAVEENTLCVVVGCGLLLIYAPVPGRAGIDDVLAFVVEGHDPLIWQELKVYYRNRPQSLTFPTIHLDMLPHMAAALAPGIVVTFDIAKQEITQRKALRHPSICRVRRQVGTYAKDQKSLSLRSLWVRDSLRTGLPEHTEDLADPYCGVVREETTYFNSSGLLQHITRICKQGETTGGRATNRETARILSYCEAVERFQAAQSWPSCPIYATYAELGEKAVDPCRLFYRMPLAGPDRRHYNAHCPMEWAWADNLTKGTRVLVPVGEVSYGSSRRGQALQFPSSTSGTALGGSYEEALLFGILELVERDSFLTAWRLRRPCRRLDPRSLVDKPFQVLLAAVTHRNPHYRLHFFDTSTDTLIPSVWVLAVREKPGYEMKTISSASCRLTYRAAMSSALDELAGLMSFNKDYQAKRPHFRRCLENPDLVHAVEEHAGLYGLDETFGQFAFLGFGELKEPVTEPSLDFFRPGRNRYDLKAILEGMLASLDSKGIEVLARNLTFPEFANRRLFCVKTTGTGLLPLSFGRAFTRFDITPRLQRLNRAWDLAHLTIGSANMSLHPLG